MNPYDLAHHLADALRNSDEHKQMEALKEKAFESETNRALIDEYKRLQYRMQAATAAGTRPDEDLVERFTKIGTLLQFNQETGEYLLAEFRFQRMLSDIFKILAQTAGVDLDLLTQE